MDQISFSARSKPDPTEPAIAVDAGLELALAMYDVFVAAWGTDFADLAKKKFEARQLRRQTVGGEEATAARIAAELFANFDWRREISGEDSSEDEPKNE